MRCLSCHRMLTSKEAQMWQKRVVVCIRCKELADRATAEIQRRHRAAEHASLFDLEQMILQGKLVQGMAPVLPGLGEAWDPDQGDAFPGLIKRSDNDV